MFPTVDPVRVTLVPETMLAEQPGGESVPAVDVQLIAPEPPVTVPVPVAVPPAVLPTMDSVYLGASENVAVTTTGPVPMEMLQELVPVQSPPPQPENTEPVATDADSTTVWPEGIAVVFMQVRFAVRFVQLSTCTFGVTDVSMPTTVPVPAPVPPLTVIVVWFKIAVTD